MSFRRWAVVLTVFTPFLVAPALAADTSKRLGKSGGWESFVYGEGAGKTCYLAAAAEKVQGGEKGKTSTYLIVTHRPGAKGMDEVSVNGTYGFKKESDVVLQVGPNRNALFTKGDRAWARDAEADKAIVALLRKGKEVTLRATPAKGPAITATLALAGFPEQLAAADKACGIKR
jgi:hypothetical protein